MSLSGLALRLIFLPCDKSCVCFCVYILICAIQSNVCSIWKSDQHHLISKNTDRIQEIIQITGNIISKFIISLKLTNCFDHQKAFSRIIKIVISNVKKTINYKQNNLLIGWEFIRLCLP